MVCSRCGRVASKESGAFVLEKHPKEDIIIGGICSECYDEIYMNGWFMDQNTNEERNEFIRIRIERYGS